MTDGPITNRSRRLVASWLLVCCALVFGMIVLGGVTRLTGSGLSMVDWRPIMGALPPLSDAQWQQTFDLYRQSPEFKLINVGMDVEGFKGIFWLEYLHRLLGRTIGLVFLLPFLYFLWSGHIQRREVPRYVAMFVLGGLQGLLGWYMVKSGLVNNPHVSQYRLTAHLMAAVAIYAYMFWVALGLIRGRDQPGGQTLFAPTVAMTGLITLTVISGGFVAGLKAGLAFNTFPKMNGQWIPDGLAAMQPAWRNLFDNIITVQFDHRLLATVTLLTVIAYWFFARRTSQPAARLGAHALLAVAIIQVTLGIWTLLHQVPVVLGAAHQATAIVLFTVALFLCHTQRSSLQ